MARLLLEAMGHTDITGVIDEMFPEVGDEIEWIERLWNIDK